MYLFTIFPFSMYLHSSKNFYGWLFPSILRTDSINIIHKQIEPKTTSGIFTFVRFHVEWFANKSFYNFVCTSDPGFNAIANFIPDFFIFF